MLRVSVHSLERYAERVMGLEEGMHLTPAQRDLINDKIMDDLEAYQECSTDMTVNVNDAKYVIKNYTVVTVNDPEPAHITKYGGVTRSGVKKYKKLKKDSVCH